MTETDLEPIVALTGAGISAASGVPTFRGDGGLWENYRAQELATPGAFREDPELVWRFYGWRRELVDDCDPNDGHRLLAEIEQATTQFTLITQNIDGLHQQAGSQNVIELHGSLWRLRCTDCKARWEDKRVPLEDMPHCPQCGALARPDVVWFGESLDSEILEEAYAISRQANTFLVVGTSAIVHPAASLPMVAKREGATLIEFNLENTPLSPQADEVHQGPASSTLSAWWQRAQSELT